MQYIKKEKNQMNCHKRTCSRRLLRKACKWSSCRI